MEEIRPAKCQTQFRLPDDPEKCAKSHAAFQSGAPHSLPKFCNSQIARWPVLCLAMTRVQWQEAQPSPRLLVLYFLFGEKRSSLQVILFRRRGSRCRPAKPREIKLRWEAR